MTKIYCTNCQAALDESEVVWDGEDKTEYCPRCGEGGCIADVINEGDKVKTRAGKSPLKTKDLVGEVITVYKESHTCIVEDKHQLYEVCIDDLIKTERTGGL